MLRWLILQKWSHRRAYPNGNNSKCKAGTKDEWNIDANHLSGLLLSIRNFWIYMCEGNIVLKYSWSNLILVPNNLEIFGEGNSFITLECLLVHTYFLLVHLQGLYISFPSQIQCNYATIQLLNATLSGIKNQRFHRQHHELFYKNCPEIKGSHLKDR